MAEPSSVSIVVYWSSVSGNLVTKREQQHVFDTLLARRIPFQAVDIASTEGATAKNMLREHSPQKLIMPQIYVEGQFRAGYPQFVDAIENEQLETLLISTKEEEDLPLH